MSWNLRGLGSLILGVLFAGNLDAQSSKTILVHHNLFELEYEVSPDALPLESVQLWYAEGKSGPWQLYGVDDDRQSPMSFRASREGLYGFYYVMRNTTGVSSMPPTAGTEPHLRVFVDATPPVVQLHSARQSDVMGLPTIQIRWSAVDAHFDSRPIRIRYMQPPNRTWHYVSQEPLANTGRYDWRLPAGLRGSLAIQIEVVDRGENRVLSERSIVDVRVKAEPSASMAASTSSAARLAAAMPTPSHNRIRIERLLAGARKDRERGDYRSGIGRLREAIRLNPGSTVALVEMADMLYHVDDLDRAQSAYEIALRQAPNMRMALQGAAMVQGRKKNYPEATRLLRSILRYNPQDAEVWMNLGDVAVFQGDEALARESYLRAMQMDPGAKKVIEDARTRLELMTKVSRRFPPQGR